MARPKRKTIEELHPAAFVALNNIDLLKAAYKTTNQQLADAAGISLRTLVSRRMAPWTFTIGELQSIARVWNFDANDLFKKIHLGDELL